MKPTKTELFYKYTDFVNLQNIGGYWMNQAMQYIPYGIWITEIAMFKIVFEQFGVPFWLIVAFVICKTYFEMVLRWVVGKFAIKIGVFKAQDMYTSKKEHLAPFNSELIATLESLCKKVGAESKFSKL